MTEEKKSSGAGKFILGAAIGAAIGAVIGKLASTKNHALDDEYDEDSCDCDEDYDCKKPLVDAEIEIGLKKKESNKKVAEKEEKKSENTKDAAKAE